MGELPNAAIPDPQVPQTEELQISDHILSISYAVVEQPVHHCGDDLVLSKLVDLCSRFDENGVLVECM